MKYPKIALSTFVIAIMLIPYNSIIAAQETQDELLSDYPTRYFVEIKDNPDHGGAFFGLACRDCKGSYSLMYETDSEGTVIGDTLLVWTQHHGEGMPIHMENAMKADMIVACYPSNMPEEAVLRSPFPTHDDVVLVLHEPNSAIILVAGTPQLESDLSDISRQRIWQQIREAQANIR